jgi:hypothetical protein
MMLMFAKNDLTKLTSIEDLRSVFITSRNVSMSTAAVERTTQILPGKARARVLTKQQLKWMLYAA